MEKSLESRKQDITVLSGMKIKGNCIETKGEYMRFLRSVPKDVRVKYGLSPLIKNKFRKLVKNWEPIDGNFIKIYMSFYVHRITISGFHGVSEYENISSEDDFLNELSDLIKGIYNKREIIIVTVEQEEDEGGRL